MKNILKHITMGAITLMAAVFLWQYNLAPLWPNTKINIAEVMTEKKACGQMTTLMDSALAHHTFLDAYVRLQYVSFLQTCAGHYPEDDLAYAKKGVHIMKEAVEIQPAYSRLWLFLGSFANVVASHESDSKIKSALLKEAGMYLDKAGQLAPNHQEIYIAKARLALEAHDYPAAKTLAETCIALNSNLGDCYFYLALAQIHLKDFTGAQESITLAEQKNYSLKISTPLNKLVDAYAVMGNYPGLAMAYEKLIQTDLVNPQYRASLAFVYAKLGRYKEARVQVNDFIRLAPDRKAEADEFLRTLPR